MDIFTSTEQVTEEYHPEFPNIEPTIESSNEIVYEMNEMTYKILAATYISDIMVESMISEGTTDIKPLTEGIIKDLIDKSIKNFNNFKAKIREWFGKISRYFADNTLIIKKYIEKNEKTILENIEKITKYEYKGIPFTNLDKLFDQSKMYLNSALAYTRQSRLDIDNSSIHVTSSSKIEKSKNEIEKIVNELYTERLQLKHFFMSDKDGVQEIISINKTDVQLYINFCKKSNDGIKKIKEIEKITINAIDYAIKNLNISKNGENATEINNKISFYNSIITSIQSLNTMIISIYKKAVNQYFGQLRKLVSNPEKLKDKE